MTRWSLCAAAALAATLLVACGGQVTMLMPACCEEAAGGDETYVPGDTAPDCAPRVASAISLNPSGEFANTLIRGRPPDSEAIGNTWTAVSEAAARGYRYIEVDVRVTSDGHFIPSRHDGLSSFTDCSGSLAASTAEALAKCHYLADASAEVLPLGVGLEGADFEGIYLDLKSTKSPPITPPALVLQAVTSLAEVVERPDTIVPMSYAEDTAAFLAQAGIRAGMKGYPPDPEGTIALVELAAAAGAEMVCMRATTLGPSVYDRGAELGVWFLNWEGAEDIDFPLLDEMVLGGVGGVINSDHEGTGDLLSRYCFE